MRLPPAYCPSSQGSPAWTPDHGVCIPTTKNCDYRGDIAGRKFAEWCEMAGMPVGVVIPGLAADLIEVAYRAQRRGGGRYEAGACGELLAQARAVLAQALTENRGMGE